LGVYKRLTTVEIGQRANQKVEIQCRKMSWPWNRDQRSLKVTESGL